ncbi:hypothetical protein PG994_007130 [Apiospora phragmitis]|uniref:Uncharacterized protein n=1 Tax=Apiospora phragmitis TaxID=2905665 RepID=A0ABR1V0N9_9PEZI
MSGKQGLISGFASGGVVDDEVCPWEFETKHSRFRLGADKEALSNQKEEPRRESREESSRLNRAPSRLALKAFNTQNTPPPTSAPLPSRSGTPQHARNLSLQNSLEKPLPEPPPVLDTNSPTTPLAPTQNNPRQAWTP